MPPNQPATQVRCFRIPDELWEAIERMADDRGETYTEVALRAFRREVRNYLIVDD